MNELSDNLSGKPLPPEKTLAPLPRKAPLKRAVDNRPICMTEGNFEHYVCGPNQPVVVEFWARWCSLSKSMAPYFTTSARKLSAQATFAKVETDEESALANRYQISCIPTVIVFRNGHEQARHCGALTAVQLGLWLQPYLAKLS